MGEIELIYSKHCQPVTGNGKTVKGKIYSSGVNDWIIEVVDKDNNPTAWENPFDTHDEAFQEFERTLNKEGIEAMIGLQH